MCRRPRLRDATLRKAGIKVDAVELPEAKALNIGFAKRLETGKPFVHIKLAASLDGRTAMADGESRWITSAATHVDVQYWRARRSSVVVTGIGTVRAEWGSPKAWPASWRTEELRSLRDLFAELPECRRDQGQEARFGDGAVAGGAGAAVGTFGAGGCGAVREGAVAGRAGGAGGNCPETFAALARLDWDAPGVHQHDAPPEKAHGRIEQRSVVARDLPRGMLRFRHARQAFRVRRRRVVAKTGETAYGICSVATERTGPERLLAWNRGHWMVENGNHHPRDASLGEDACRVRVRHAPANNAIMNNIALAVVRHRSSRFVPEAVDHFSMRREDAFDAVLSPA